MKQPDLYYFESIKMTRQAWSNFTGNTRLWLVFSIQNLTRLVTSFLWFQNSIDKSVSHTKCCYNELNFVYSIRVMMLQDHCIDSNANYTLHEIALVLSHEQRAIIL